MRRRTFRSEMQRLWGGNEIMTPSYAGGKATATSVADNAAKAVRWGVSEMGLLLTVDGRECPGCDAPQRFCWNTQTQIHCPAGVNAVELTQRLAQAYGRSDAFGRVSDTVFFLDPARLGNLTANSVVDLLNATGNALRQMGCQLDVNAGVGVADRILRES